MMMTVKTTPTLGMTETAHLGASSFLGSSPRLSFGDFALEKQRQEVSAERSLSSRGCFDRIGLCCGLCLLKD